jgi:hypothetical protein
MINIIKDKNGAVIREAEEKYVVELVDGQMIEAGSFREATAVIVGKEYIDCETAETEWHVRINAAKKIGRMLQALENQDRTIVYDERMGKIPYSYTDQTPDYQIPANPELIRIECDETFILSLVKIRYINLWEKTEHDYQNYLANRDVDREIEVYLKPFAEKKVNIPLHQRL